MLDRIEQLEYSSSVKIDVIELDLVLLAANLTSTTNGQAPKEMKIVCLAVLWTYELELVIGST